MNEAQDEVDRLSAELAANHAKMTPQRSAFEEWWAANDDAVAYRCSRELDYETACEIAWNAAIDAVLENRLISGVRPKYYRDWITQAVEALRGTE